MYDKEKHDGKDSNLNWSRTGVFFFFYKATEALFALQTLR
jgi:hypothetical protein